MSKIEKIIKKIFNNNIKLAVLILFLLELLINIWITPNRYDSAFFIEQMQKMPLMDFISMRYQTWTSRIFIEIVVCTVLSHNKIIWILMNTVMTTLIGYSILKLFVKKDNKEMIWISLIFILLYPLNKVATCDWGAGTINYTWPLALLLFSTISIRKIWNKEKIKIYMYPIYILTLIFACNQEQCCMIAFGIYFLFIILSFIKNNKKVHPFIIIQWLITLASILLIVTCPGNYARKLDEIITYYPNFETLTILDKVSLGLTSTTNNLLTNGNIVFIIFSALSALIICKKYKNNLFKIIACIPLVFSLIFSVFKDNICAIYPYFGMLCDKLELQTVILNSTNYFEPINYLPLIISFILLGSIFLNILLIFKNIDNNIGLLIFILGLASRVAMGFSPTVFASTDRTFIFFEFALIINCILMWQLCLEKYKEKFDKTLSNMSVIILIVAILEYLHTLIYTFVSQM